MTDVEPIFRRFGQRRFGTAVRFVVVQVRQVDRQVGVNRPHQPGLVAVVVQLVQDRERLAPEPLPAEQPVAQLVVDRPRPSPVRGQVGGDLFLEFGVAVRRIRPS
jgi:hypothetical protein